VKIKTNAGTTTTGRAVTVWVQKHTLRRLDQAARALGISRSDLMRIAIDERVGAVLDGPHPDELAAFTAARADRAVAATVATEEAP